MSSSRRWLTPFIVGVFALLVYLATLAPGLSWAHSGTDSGDLITAAAVLGVPHPPGYPTYTFLGHLFISLPFGNPAYNLNLMSALAAALAAALFTSSILKGLQSSNSETQFAASVAGLTLAFSPMFWGQATIAEVHALNAFFVAAICFVTVPWTSTHEPLQGGKRIALGVLWGLGLGNSITIAAMLPIALPALWRGARGRWVAFVAFGVGLSIYFLIPIRANTLPAISWGDARSLPNFLWLVTGELYRGYVLAAAPELILQRVLSLPRVWLEQVGWIGAAWVGWAFLYRFDLKRIAPVALSIVLYVVFAVGYNTVDSNLYLIPVWLLAGGYLGHGLADVMRTQTNRNRRIAVGFIALAVPFMMLLTGWHAHDLSVDHTVSEFTEEILASLPTDAILLTHTDGHTFALWYDVLVRARRQDVAIVDTRLIEYEWYELMLDAQGAAPIVPETRTATKLFDQFVATNPTRPVCDLMGAPPKVVCPSQQTVDD